jgi:hypothetical protein
VIAAAVVLIIAGAIAMSIVRTREIDRAAAANAAARERRRDVDRAREDER